MQGKLTAMSGLFAVLFLLLLLVSIASLLEHNHRRTVGLPRPRFGLDPSRDADLWRIRHDLDVAPLRTLR